MLQGRGELPTCDIMPAQIVFVADAEVANLVLGAGEGLDKALEPALSDLLLSHRLGHHTMFSSGTNSPYWRLIRKGAAPAFRVENIRCSPALPIIGFESPACDIVRVAHCIMDCSDVRCPSICCY